MSATSACPEKKLNGINCPEPTIQFTCRVSEERKQRIAAAIPIENTGSLNGCQLVANQKAAVKSPGLITAVSYNEYNNDNDKLNPIRSANMLY